MAMNDFPYRWIRIACHNAIIQQIQQKRIELIKSILNSTENWNSILPNSKLLYQYCLTFSFLNSQSKSEHLEELNSMLNSES
ncbi:hypothetical protein T03_8820 [Trichinella britovi]|uniref:Uncharacterized protein n=1 Tax=Trichinella britovi TaxID=45882 RepID=A0A0V1DF08_TRIBR|nr:hypothetical protein T03_8820 [Trichinella britovi]